MPPANLSLRPNFEYTKVDGAQKKRARCLHCDEYSYTQNSTREKEHLETYKGLKALAQNTNIPAIKQQKLDNTIFVRILADRKAKIDEQLASCIFQTNKPLSLFDDNCWLRFFQDNFGYTPPSSSTISGPLLEKVYKSTKEEVKAELSSSAFLGLVMDESTNINQHRIINTSVVTNSNDAWYWKNKEAAEGKLGAKELTALAIKAREDITEHNLTR